MITQIPDSISTLDLSKIWLLKALQQLEEEAQQEPEIEQVEAEPED
ncbi:MAG TPA: hypothetical protein V6D18_13925 [Thermosynechococcaceae cyanobacterium]